ncbi:MAG: hypothetical protein Q8P67_04800 [archaeon]|nr:hypothetical protein [archaeon]
MMDPFSYIATFHLSEWQCSLATMGLAVLWLAAMEWLAAVGATSRDTTRKLVHIGTGPIYVGCWVFFPHSASARYWAALVPLLITLRFYLIGVGAISDPRTVSSMSRSGDRRELLKGPLCYGIIFILSTIIWFVSFSSSSSSFFFFFSH